MTVFIDFVDVTSDMMFKGYIVVPKRGESGNHVIPFSCNIDVDDVAHLEDDDGYFKLLGDDGETVFSMLSLNTTPARVSDEIPWFNGAHDELIVSMVLRKCMQVNAAITV